MKTPGEKDFDAAARVTLAPVLALRVHTIAAHLCAPLIVEHGERRIGHDPQFILEGRGGHLNFLELDLSLLDHGVKESEQAMRSGAKYLMGIQVHSTTLHQKDARDIYLAHLARVDPKVLRSTFIAITEIERGTSLVAIAEWIAMIKAHAPRVALDFHFADDPMPGLHVTGAWAAGCHLPILHCAQHGPLARRTIARIEHWTRRLHDQNLRVFVNGIRDMNLVRELQNIDVDFATSETLWPGAHMTNAGTEPPPADIPREAVAH